MIIQFPDVERIRRDSVRRGQGARRALTIAAVQAGADSRSPRGQPRRGARDLSGGMNDAARQRVRAMTPESFNRKRMDHTEAAIIARDLRDAFALRPELIGSVVAFLSPSAAERLALQ